MVTAEFGGKRATFPKLQIPPKARLERDWVGEHRKWFERVAITPFASQVKGQPWADEAVRFLQESFAAWRPMDLTDLHPELAKAAEALMAQKCEEPLVRFFAAYWRYRNSIQYSERMQGITALTYYDHKDGEKEIDAMQGAMRDLEKRGFPRAPMRLFADEIASAWARGYYENRAVPWRAKVAEWTEKALGEGSYRADEAHIFVGQTIRYTLYSRPQLGAMAAAVEKSSLPEWAREAVLGAFAREGAWKERGGGWAVNVTEQGWRGFGENLGRAREHLQKSWKANSTRPEVPGLFLDVLLSGAGRPGDEPSVWFNRAIAAEADYPKVYSTSLWYRRPRWGGTIAEMLALGRACLEAKRYDTNLPDIFMKAVLDSAVEAGNWRFVTHIPWVGKGMVDVTRGLLAEPGRASDRDRLKSLLVTRAWMARQYELAQQTLKEIPNGELHLTALDELQNFRTYPDVMLQDLAVHGTPAWAEYEKGIAASVSYLSSDPAAALKHFQAALASAPKGSEAEKVLQTQVTLSEFNVKFDSGEWTPVPLNIDAWRVRAGKFSNDAEAALIMHTNKDRRGFAWFQERIGQSYEVRGRFSAAPGATAPPTFGIGFRANRSVTSEYLHFSCSPVDGGKMLEVKLRDHFQDLNEGGRLPKVGRALRRDENEFLLRVTPTTASFELNGEVVVPEFPTKRYVRRDVDGRLALVTSHYKPETATRITALEIRKSAGR